MVGVSYRQKPYRRVLMEAWGGKVVASPSELTEPGRAIRAQHNGSGGEHPGSLGIAISEAVFEAELMFARTEGHVPAPESAHAVRAAIDETLKAKEEGRQKTILFCLSGHGHFDLAAYEAYMHDEFTDHELGEEEIARAQASLPDVHLPQHEHHHAHDHEHMHEHEAA